MASSSQVLCSSGVGFLENDVQTLYDRQFSRKKYPYYEDLIDEAWTIKMKEGCFLFDQSKFRFHRAVVDGETVILHVGLTTYKDFIGTNCAPHGKDLLSLGMCDLANSSDGSGLIFLANPLGVGALLETKDNKFVFLNRSQKCAESPGLIDRPGGHPEPDELLTSDIRDMNQLTSKEMTREIFESVLRELEDEVNVPRDKLNPPVLLGVSFNKDLCLRPSLEFYVSCELSSQEIQTLYSKQAHKEQYESTSIFIVSRGDLKELCLNEKDERLNLVTNATKSALYLISIYNSWAQRND